MKEKESICTSYSIILKNVAFLLFLAVLLCSCGEQNPAITKTRETEHTDIDYLDVNNPTTAIIHETEYQLITYYTQWVPILYYSKDFDAVEQHIADLLIGNDEAKAYELYILYIVLGKITHDRHVDYMKSVLDEWCSKHADSHIPWLVRGIFYIDWAWKIRGGGFAKDVQKEAWPKSQHKHCRELKVEWIRHIKLYFTPTGCCTMSIGVPAVVTQEKQ